MARPARYERFSVATSARAAGLAGHDGYRIRDGRSYDLVNALSLSPRMELVVWREGSYHDVTTELWDRRFRVDMEDLAPRK